MVLFTMAVYLTPVLGGWLADNFIGQRKAIIWGGIDILRRLLYA